MVEPFEVLTLEQLRARQSIKWQQHAPDVLPLWIAEMDALLPPSVTEALVADLITGDAGYPPLDAAYAEAFADVAAARWGWTFDPAGSTVCADTLTGIIRSLDLLTQPGETVLVPAPVYMPLLFLPAEMGRRVGQVPMTPDGRLDLDALAAAMATTPPRHCFCAVRTTRSAPCTPRTSCERWRRSRPSTASAWSSTRSTRCLCPTEVLSSRRTSR